MLQKKVIHYAGLILLFSPLFNLFSTGIQSEVFLQHAFHFKLLWVFIFSIPGLIWLSWFSAAFAGYYMLKDHRHSWKTILGFLGLNILLRVLTHSANDFSFFINLILFGFVCLDQTNWTPEEDFSLELKNGLPVDFEGLGVWATITEISNKGLKLQATAHFIPEGLESRTLEFRLNSKLTLKARLNGQSGTSFLLEFVQIHPLQCAYLHRWALKQT